MSTTTTIYTPYHGNWRGKAVFTYTSVSSIQCVLYICRKGTGTLATATFYTRTGYTARSSDIYENSMSINKSKWTSSNQEIKIASFSTSIPILSYPYLGKIYVSFKYNSSGAWYDLIHPLEIIVFPSSGYYVATKAGGSWERGIIFVKIDTSWHDVVSVWIKENGAWKSNSS